MVPGAASRFPIQTVLSMASMWMRQVFTIALAVAQFRDEGVRESGSLLGDIEKERRSAPQ
jgi:hypothetical protein